MPYTVWNGPAPTTAAQLAVSTGTGVKTMLQIATPSTRQIQLISWGFSFDDFPGDDSTIELLQTDVAATVTAHVAAGIQPLDPNGAPSLCIGGTALTGYTASAEGTTTASRVFDVVGFGTAAGIVNSPYTYQWMPDERPVVAVSKFLRVRTTVAVSAVDFRCWVRYIEVG